MSRFWLGLVAFVCCLHVSLPAHAGLPGHVPDRLQLQRGGSLVSFDTDVGLGLICRDPFAGGGRSRLLEEP
jgi:hypothetical protein